MTGKQAHCFNYIELTNIRICHLTYKHLSPYSPTKQFILSFSTKHFTKHFYALVQISRYKFQDTISFHDVKMALYHNVSNNYSH